MSGLSANEVTREARRILRKLTGDNVRLVPREGGEHALMERNNAHETARVTAALVEEFLKRDWLMREGDVLVISDVGAGWLTRETAESDGFAAQHRALAERVVMGPHGEEKRVTVNEGESPLGWLKRRRLIDAVQFEAGETLRRDYTLGQISPRMGVDFDAPLVGGRRAAKATAPLTETTLAAKQRFAQAMSAVGPGLSDLLFDVCCHLIGLEQAERAKSWPRRSAKVVLHIALDRLALHYGLRVVGPHRAMVRNWRMEEGK